MNEKEKLLKLIQDNSNLPIVFECSSDELCDDYCTTFFTNFSCKICDIYETEDYIYDDVIDVTEYYQNIYADEYENLSNEEFDKKIKELVDETPHYKAIRVFCS